MPVNIAGLDVGFSNDYMALVIVEKSSADGKEVIKLVHLYTWNRMDWNIWKQDMETKNKEFGYPRVYVDQTNNLSVVSELQSLGISAIGVSFTNASKRDMILHLTKLLDTGDLVLPMKERIESPSQRRYFGELLMQMAEQEIIHDSANPKFAHPSGQHDDLLWALCLAVYGTPNEVEFYAALSRGDKPWY